MITLGLTGGIGSGKSEVSRLLGARGAFIIDADRVAHQTYAPGGPAYQDVARAFGPAVIGADGSIDRRALGAIVFADPARLRRLTDIVWPHCEDAFAAVLQEQAQAGTKVAVLEAAVLLQAGWDRFADEVWVVRAPLAAVCQRLRESRGLSDAEIEARIAASVLPDLARAHVVIDNDGSLAELEAKVEDAWQALLRRTQR